MQWAACPPLLRWRVLPVSYFCRLCLLKVYMESSSLILTPSPVCWTHPALSAACPFQFLVYYSVFWFFFLRGGGQSVQGTMLVYSRGGHGSTVCYLFAHLLVCVSQAGLELVSGGVGALGFFQCNVVWRSFVWAGVRVLLLLCGFFLPSVALGSQQDFWFTELMLFPPSSHHLGSQFLFLVWCITVLLAALHPYTWSLSNLIYSQKLTCVN
jgi:hypothetical protein